MKLGDHKFEGPINSSLSGGQMSVIPAVSQNSGIAFSYLLHEVRGP